MTTDIYPARTHYYRVHCQHTLRVWDIAGRAQEGGPTLRHAHWKCSDSQKFLFVALENGSYIIAPKSTRGRVLDVANAGDEDRTPIIVYPFHGGTNQQFNIVDVGAGYVRLKAANSEKVIDHGLDGAPPWNRTPNIWLFEYRGQTNQHWRLEPVEDLLIPEGDHSHTDDIPDPVLDSLHETPPDFWPSEPVVVASWIIPMLWLPSSNREPPYRRIVHKQQWRLVASHTFSGNTDSNETVSITWTDKYVTSIKLAHDMVNTLKITADAQIDVLNAKIGSEIGSILELSRRFESMATIEQTHTKSTTWQSARPVTMAAYAMVDYWELVGVKEWAILNAERTITVTRGS
jgi:hypothetical protein